MATLLPAPFLTAAIDDQQMKYFSMIGPTILVYDWLITIDAESTHVWSRRWGIIEFLYMFSRYMPFADTPVMLIYHFYLVDPSIEACRTALTAQYIMYCIGMSVSEQIFTIRTWAVWEGSKVMGLILFTEATCVFGLQLYLTVLYANSLTYFQGYNLGGCFVLTSSKVVLFSMGIFLFIQFAYLVLVILKIYPTVSSERGISLLLNVILQDGILFYIMLFVLIFVNIIFLFQPGTISTVLAVPSRICHSIFASRIILHMRDVDKRGSKDAFTSTRSVMFTDVLDQIEMEDTSFG